MNAAGGSDFRAEWRPPRSTHPAIGVHVLSEHVFCPRAAIIAQESGPDEGNEEPNLGPRLDLLGDYDEHRFTEDLQQSWGDMRLWLTLLAPAVLIVLLAGSLHSFYAGVIVSLPVLILLQKCAETLAQIIQLVRERSRLRAAAVVEIDLKSTEVRWLDWWSLRKSGFDCIKLLDPLTTPDDELTGKPWRMLRLGNTIGIPVIRRHPGSTEWGPQHEVRLAAYCELIEQCETRSSPFGVILFADTRRCVLIPITAAVKMRLQLALESLREFLEVEARGTHMAQAPTDRRCSGCLHGKPVKFQPGETEFRLNGKTLPANAINSVHESDGKLRGAFHSLCGDRFRWAPPHRNAVYLGIAQAVSSDKDS